MVYFIIIALYNLLHNQSEHFFFINFVISSSLKLQEYRNAGNYYTKVLGTALPEHAFRRPPRISWP